MSGTLRLTGVLGGNLLLSGNKAAAATVSLKSNLALIKSIPKSPNVQQTASMLSVAKMDKNEKPPPFPYMRKKYTKFHLSLPFLDITQMRFDYNTKLITVESNIGAGKAEFAKELAEKFGMLYMAEPKIEDFVVNDEGVDYRKLNQYIHPKLAAIDEKMFYEDPTHPAVAWYKIFWYRLRYIQYIDALAHMFNTGQGVVLERCPQTDMVFTDAMHKNGFLPQDAYDYYYRLRYDTIHWLLRPHLIIYLDADPDILHKRIKDKGIPYINNSKVMTKKYLEDIDASYKEKYLEDARQYSELLIYKWNQPGDMNDIVLDIERLNMDDWDYKQPKFTDWNFFQNKDWDAKRYTYTREKIDLLAGFQLTDIYDTDSLWVDLNEYEHREKVYESFIPNYGVINANNADKVGLFRALFSFPHWRSEEKHIMRYPFY